MNVEKALYMKEFLELRNNLGTIHNKIAPHSLFTNMYNELMPRKEKNKVKEVVEEIEEKTIQILSNKEKGNLPKDTGNLPKDTGNLPKDTGNLPKKTGNLPKDTGNLPKKTGNLPKDTGNLPKDTGNLPKENKDESGPTTDKLTLFDDAKLNEADSSNENDGSDQDGGDQDASDQDASDQDAKVSEIDLDLLGGGHQVKKIVINPNYVALDK
jgi:hypothetical protein